MTYRLVRAAALIGLCVLLTGCSAGASTAAAPTRTATVDLPPSYVFKPDAIEVKAGTSVTWTNHDNFTHSVQVQGQGVDASVHMLSPGQTTSITFSAPGTYNYICTLHAQNMKGTVVVDAA